MNVFGEPVQVPTELVSICPFCAEPRICGGEAFVGSAVGFVPAGETAAVGAEAAAALPVRDVAVTTTLSECPTSSLTGLYDSAIALGIVVQFAPAASQRLHWYVNVIGFPPSQVPGTAAKRSPTSFCTIATQRVTAGSSSIVRRIAPAAIP